MSLRASAADVVTVVIDPSTYTMKLGADHNFSGKANGATDSSVTWTVMGDATFGTITSASPNLGHYVAPKTSPSNGRVYIKATSVANPSAFAYAVVTLGTDTTQPKSPTIASVTPTSMPTGAFSINVKGTNFTSTSQVLWNGTALTTTFSSSTSLYATGNAPSAGDFNVTVSNSATLVSNAVSVKVVQPIITSVTPTSMPTGAFTINVKGSNFTSTSQVLWNGTPLTPLSSSSTTSTTSLYATGNAPNAGDFNVTVSNGANQVSNAVSVKVIQPVSVSVSPTSTSLATNGKQQFQATVVGSANQAVTWLVNGSSTADPANGVIDLSGLYTAPSVRPTTGVVTISAVAAADTLKVASAVVFIQDPAAVTTGRILDQTTFGATPQLMAHVGLVGPSAFIDEQFNTAESPWPAALGSSRNDAIDAFFGHFVSGQDQLRQRVIYALSEVIVISENKNTNGEDVIPWLQILSKNAFGNYRNLLRDISNDGSMGKYLDLANSGANGSAANENYPREVMQLFSIGLVKLNNDGSPQLDSTGQPIPTYTQTDVQQMAKALTGWTYNSAIGTVNGGGNGSYYPGAMLPMPGTAHNKSAKTILGVNVPANQTTAQDLDSAIDILFNHPNLGPFVATRLIRALVTSNPSPKYISDVADVFNGNMGSPRGDMKATIRAILMHPEARNDNPGSTFGRLRTPVEFIAGVSRSLGLNVGNASGFNYLMLNMNDGILDANSVFGHYSPMYRIPNGGGLFGPEFQIFSASDDVVRAQFFYGMIYQPWPINPKLQPFVGIAGNSATLVNAVDSALLYGRMSATTRSAILTALPAMADNNQRVMTALYLAAMSGDYLVQR